MNNAIVLTSIFFLLFSGCSFSKESSLPKSYLSFQYSEKQKNLLAAIKLGDANLAKSIISSLSPSDHLFRNQTDTPMSIAIETNQPEMVKLIIKNKLDSGNIGKINDSLNKKILSVSQKDILKKINTFEANKNINELTEAEVEFYNFQKDTLFKELEGTSLKNLTKFEANLKKYNLNCNLVASHIVIWFQSKDKNLSFSQFADFVDTLPCFSSAEEISFLYKIELIRQFQNLFKNTSILKFIFNHKNFSNPMWEIDESGIWLSPSALLKIAYSGENHHKEIQEQCSNLESNCSDEIISAYKNAKTFLKTKSGEKYEVIIAKDGKVEFTFLYFEDNHINDLDPFYERVVDYIYSIKGAKTDNPDSRWIIDGQLLEDGNHD